MVLSLFASFATQILSEYPEAKMTSEQQYASLGESYSDLVNRLDEGILPLLF